MRENQLLSEKYCLFCEDKRAKIFILHNLLPSRVSVLKCQACSLVFLDVQAKSDELSPEETVYWDKEEQNKIYLQEKVRNTFNIEFVNRLETLEKLSKKKRRLLDVGCGVGHFMDVARKRGWESGVLL